MMKTILIVDDEPKIVRLVRDYLERAGYRVLSAGEGQAALAMARSEKPDLILLDLGLPGLDGLDVTRNLRKNSNVPVIMLTARDEESDKLIGLELGADDYITKPFSPKEMVARIRALFRRIEALQEGEVTRVIQVGDIVLDVERMQVSVAGRSVEMTPTEFELLKTLAMQPGRIFTRAQLLDAIHGVAFDSYERAIDTHIKNIRRKIEADSHQPRYILTVYGVGYRFAEK
jgi:DNA-binding response OmpR family regulator